MILKIQSIKSKALFLSFSTITILLLSLAPLALAQETATVITSATTGGTTSPIPGTYTYNQDSIIRIEAKPDVGYVFLQWVIIGGYTPGHNESPLILPSDEEPFPPPRSQQHRLMIV